MKRSVLISVVLTVILQWPIAEASFAGASGGMPEDTSPDAWIAIAIIFIVLFVGTLVAALRAQNREMRRELTKGEGR